MGARVELGRSHFAIDLGHVVTRARRLFGVGLPFLLQFDLSIIFVKTYSPVRGAHGP